jgi:NADP-dependent 3-hydroxy acid dehydrogenase YdfG
MFDERGKQEAHHHCGCNTDTKIPALADEKEIYRVNKEIETHDAVDEQEEQATVEASRRDFLRMGGMGLAGMAGAAALGLQPSDVYAEAKKSGEKRVTILFDSWNHMMPALAREMVRRNHDLVLGQARDKELIKELREMGARIEVVEDTEDQVKLETFQKLVDRAQEAFGGFNSACIRTGHHVNASALTGTEKDLDTVYGGNLKSVFFALQAIVPPLAAQGSGQVVINTSAGASRPQPPQALYCATRQAANGLVRATALEVAAKGISQLPPHGGRRRESGKTQSRDGQFPDEAVYPARGRGEFRGHPDRWQGHRPDRPVLFDRRWLQHHLSRSRHL